MTDRDAFAAAALTGLLVHANDGIDEETLDTPSDIAYTAYQMADAMLRERERTAQKMAESDSVRAACTDHDAAPAARACTDADRDRPDNPAPRPGEGTGDPCTPPPHATPAQGSVKVRDSRNAIEPVAWAVEAGGELEASFCGRTGLEDAADWREQSDGTIVPLYRQPQTCPHVRGNVTHYCSLNFTLTDAEREAVERAIRTLDGWQKTGGYHSAIDDDSATLRGLLERLGGER